jgi:1,4-alpha-glucan branching enzyme
MQLLAEGLVQRGHQVFVLSKGDRDGTSQQQGVCIKRLAYTVPDFQGKQGPLAFLSLALESLRHEVIYRRRVATAVEELLKSHHFDLIEAVDAFADPVFFDPSRHPHLPYIVKIHTPLSVAEQFDRNIPVWGRWFIGFFECRHLLRASHLYAPSHLVADKTRQDLRLGQKDIAIIANVPPKHLQSLEPGPEINTGMPNVLFVGRIVRFKGVHVLLEAIPEVLKDYPETQFYFAGSDFFAGDDYKIPQLLKRVDPSFHKQLHFLGHVPYEDLAQYYRQADLCVIPSLFDNFPYTGLEAMAFGKAIVASDKVGLLESVSASSILSFPAGDASALAVQIKTLLASKSYCQQLGQRVYQEAKKAFNSDTIMDQIEAFYRRAIADRH